MKNDLTTQMHRLMKQKRSSAVFFPQTSSSGQRLLQIIYEANRQVLTLSSRTIHSSNRGIRPYDIVSYLLQLFSPLLKQRVLRSSEKHSVQKLFLDTYLLDSGIYPTSIGALLWSSYADWYIIYVHVISTISEILYGASMINTAVFFF